MKAYWVFGVAMAAGLSAQASAKVGSQSQECTVMLYAHVDVIMPSGILPRAQIKAAAMFREIGVKVHWSAGAVPAYTVDGGCGAPIVIKFDVAAPATFKQDALAYALPYSESVTCIHLFMDRIAGSLDGEGVTSLLAHVLAHEITHVLEGVSRHSNGGMMKAHWELRDMRRMECHPLAFAAEDVEMIHLGIVSRMKRATGTATE